MRIYREHYTGKDGKRKMCEKWYLDFRDHRGRRRKMPGFKEKRKSEYFANHVESLVSCRGAGQSIPPDLQLWIERLPEQTLKKFVGWDLIDSQRSHGTKLLVEHLADWKQSLMAKGTAKNAELKHSRVTRVFGTCKFPYFSSISASKVELCISKLNK